jgi:hypothetical protein
MQAFLVTSLVTDYFTIAETGGGASLGWSLDGVYTSSAFKKILLV